MLTICVGQRGIMVQKTKKKEKKSHAFSLEVFSKWPLCPHLSSNPSKSDFCFFPPPPSFLVHCFLFT